MLQVNYVHRNFSVVGHQSSMSSVKSWHFVFYSQLNIWYLGFVCCIWFIGWSYYAYNSPSEHPRITYSEKLYLLRCIPKQKKVERHIYELIRSTCRLLVSNSLVSNSNECSTLCYCCAACLYKFCVLYIINNATNLFFDNSSFQFKTEWGYVCYSLHISFDCNDSCWSIRWSNTSTRDSIDNSN